MRFSTCPAGATGVALALLLTVIGRAAEAGPSPSSAILQDLRSFDTVATVLHVAAHPDDENRPLLAFLSRGRGYRTGYLSVTRGDGGQNEIGPEFGEKLGVARTQELLAGRRLDGARQFFTRALDFGYSKSMDETLAFWDRKQVLGDVVRVIRTFRPDVIITRFAPVAQRGNHGHHNASAVLALEAFKVAGDPKAFPEQIAEGLTPWQPKRIFQNGGGPGGGGGAGALIIEAGGNDPATGEAFTGIAARTSAMHKTQGVGGFGGGRGGGGPRQESFILLDGEPATKDILDGVDTTWGRYSGGAEVGKLTDDAIAQFKAEDPAASVPALLAIRAKLAGLPVDPVIVDKRLQLDRILQACLGLTVETIAERPEVAPGEQLKIKLSVASQSSVPVKWLGANLTHPFHAMQVTANLRSGETRTLQPGKSLTSEITEKVPADMPPTQPYWLREEGTKGMFRVDDAKLIGTPENPPAFSVKYEFEVGGQKLVVADAAAAKEATTERMRNVVVISPVALEFGSPVALFAPGGRKVVEVEVTAARVGANGNLQLQAPAGWSVAPARQPFKLAKIGDKMRATFTVTAPARAASGGLKAVAEIDGERFSNQRIEIRYDHIPVQLLQPAAQIKVTAFDFAIRGKNVGYLPGAGDDTVSSLQQLGYAVTTLTGADLTPEKLRALDAVVIGVRAFNERTDLAANIKGLFDYVENGGTVIAQYNRPGGNIRASLGPYELSIAGGAPALRVTDENAPVTFVAADHPVLNVPNKITTADFDGWVQERGAYFASKWDEAHYTPILSMSDPGETQPNSSLLVAKHGKGYYVYTSLAFFRQLPAGVPGAYRLFANLVSLGK